jgi:superfamily II DNA helicase RecQ
MTGRAGRDGEPSKCHLFYNEKEFVTASFWVQKADPKLQHTMTQHLESMKVCATAPVS